MKSFYKIAFGLLFLFSGKLLAQHSSKISVIVDSENKVLKVKQELLFKNQSSESINHIILNDWNHSYSSKNTPLAKRFSDEFIRSFHLAKKHERGSTNDITISTESQTSLNWSRPENHPDLIKAELENVLLPNQEIKLFLNYSVKIPSDKFTGYGYGEKRKMYLKNWFLAPALFENGAFVLYSNNNSDDIANAASDYEVSIGIDEGIRLVSDLDIINSDSKTIILSGKNRTDFSIFLGPKLQFERYKNEIVEVYTDLKDNNLDPIQKALLVDRVTSFVNDKIGEFPFQKITISQTDYERNPFYGLNQLPSFMSPFQNDFLFEIKFLKTYINNYLKNTLKLDPRKDNWIYDGIQIYTMMQYMDEIYPNAKMMGNASKYWLVRNYRLTNLPFNEQYSYFYLLMARKNLDQPLNESKDNLIKFNEQIAGKYRAGLSFRYLGSFMGKENLDKAVSDFYKKNVSQNEIRRIDFESDVKNQTNKNVDWFFNTVVDTREIIDYKFRGVSKTKDSVTFTLKNTTKANVPIPVYGIKNNEIVFKEWLENVETDSTFTLPRKDAERLAINYENDVPEYNLRNNWHSLKGFKIANKPFKFTVMKDLEDPHYNQVLYAPTALYNLYDGISPGIRIHNKAILNKPFVYSANPTYSPNTQSLIGNFSIGFNQNNRDSQLYNIAYTASGSYFHYAPDVAYFKFNPAIYFRIRDEDFRENRKQLILIRNVLVNKEHYELNPIDEPERYSVFNLKYFNTRTETIRHFNFMTDLQFSKQFGKVSAEVEFRRLFNDNRQISLRLFAGTFFYHKSDSDYFSFGLDRPTDYLFDYDYYGRSETSGIFSQQLNLSDGAFKSRLDTPFANQWMTTANLGFNVWNWVEIYGDAGFIKNKFRRERFVYDSGIRLNLVTDYFELYFPVYSNNGWEIAQPKYGEKIRFVVTLDPRILVNLFTRKWF